MSLGLVPAGHAVPDDVNVVIEIPRHADPVKYEVDKATGTMFVDRFLTTAMYYPTNYGYVPKTLSEDGDPVDVLAVTPFRLIPGSVVRCRPVGMLKMEDEAGKDAKLLAVPIRKLTTLYDDVDTFQDLPKELLDRISHFFEHYKDLESGKWVRVVGWAGPDEARREIIDSVARYDEARDKPAF